MMKSLFGKKTLRTVAAAALLVCCSTPQSWAWGRVGHRLTALVAMHYLTPETQAAVKDLLGKDSLADVASWADDTRTPATGPWHYADTLSTDPKYNRDRDCPLPPNDPKATWRDCVVDRIAYFEMRLSDKSLSKADRTEALKYVVHFIGDIHQPFHMVGDARGGNSITVNFMGSPMCGSYKCNLHGVWDSEMISHHDMPEPKYVAYLLSDIQEHNWENMAGGTPLQWANVSHHYAINAMAPNGALITKQYYTEEIQVVDAELALGGLRLARVLNTILSNQPVPPMPKAPETPGRTQLPKPEAVEPAEKPKS